VFDMSASQAAYGKVLAAAASGETLPEGWALDAEGQPTQDAKAAAAGMLVPAAGAKGIGLAMMVECLAGSLSGTRPVWGGGLFGGFVLVIRTSAAVDAQAFTADLQDWLAHYAASGPGNRYPGERAQALFEDQSRTGVPLGGALVGKLGEIGARAGVPFISALEGDGA
jgi:LDH2 family malate/lactate/ureidoglycolate dehydrogenase